MDSLTQLTLGAAVGEAVLGQKVGNRAIVWGGIAGTIPDLDVLANFFTDEITALAFHRGISHSLFFAALTPFLLGWLVHSWYDRREWYKGTATYLDWVHLFFWAIITHPLLDSCTTYGTQLFQPFWDYRVAFNNISVVDPLYTLPFLVCVIMAMRYTRLHPKRAWFNRLGLMLSTGYLVLTFAVKWHVDRVFVRSLEEQAISYQRYMTSPTIFNNILWQGIAEGDSTFHHGMYSLLDRESRVTEFRALPKNHYLLKGHEDNRDIKVLRWFSDGYYNVLLLPGGQLQLNDLRFGAISGSFEKSTDFVFRFELLVQGDTLIARQSREGMEINGTMFRQFAARIRGIR
jgi:inner membrane protein